MSSDTTISRPLLPQTFIDRRESLYAAQAAYYGTIVVGKCAALLLYPQRWQARYVKKQEQQKKLTHQSIQA